MDKKILIADSNEINREVLSELFSEDYEVVEAEDGKVALATIRSGYQGLTAVIMDVKLPEIDGITILEAIKKQEWGYKLPVIMLSEDGSLKTEKKAYASGAAYFSKKPFDAGLIKKRVDDISELYEARVLVRTGNVSADTPEDKEETAENKAKVKDTNKMFDSIIEFIGRLVESRDPENQNHIYRIKGLVKIMATKMQELYPEYKLTPQKVAMIVTACSIHDIGKVAIPDSIVLKPGRLTDEEYEYMKSHTLRGVKLFDDIDFEWDEEFKTVAKEIIRSHHEKYDGGGYPDGLKGDDIPITAQIVSLADTYDALVNDRVYRKAFSKEDAFNMIIVGDSGIFPPRILECFKACRGELEAWENKSPGTMDTVKSGRLSENLPDLT